MKIQSVFILFLLIFLLEMFGETLRSTKKNYREEMIRRDHRLNWIGEAASVGVSKKKLSFFFFLIYLMNHFGYSYLISTSAVLLSTCQICVNVFFLLRCFKINRFYWNVFVNTLSHMYEQWIRKHFFLLHGTFTQLVFPSIMLVFLLKS